MAGALSDNRYEVYYAYLWVMGMSCLFLITQYVIFYLPTQQKNFEALEYLRKTATIDLGELTEKDARYYGSYLQSAADMSGKSSTFGLWMLATHALFLAMAYLCERIFARQFLGKFYYQDLTLEFRYLSDKFTDETKILELFKFLSSDNVREISLVYDMSEYFTLKRKLEELEQKIKTEGSTENEAFKLTMLQDRRESYLNHFESYKGAYFQHRGFVTFQTHKIAFEMKEIFKKAFKNRNPGFIQSMLSTFQQKKVAMKKESPIKIKFRNIVLTKLINPKRKNKQDEVSRLTNLLIGAPGSLFNKKVGVMRQHGGPNLDLNRGIAAEDINWSYVPEKKVDTSKMLLLFAIILLVLPGFMYALSVRYYENTIDNMRGLDRGKVGFIVDQLLFVSMLGLDQIALQVIERMLPTHSFLKSHQAVGLKFLATNLYFLFSGLFFLFLGLMSAAKNKMSDIIFEKDRFNVTKQLLDSFYMTFIALIASNMISIIMKPIFQHYYTDKGKKVSRDISYSLSFFCLTIYYVGFFSPLDSNIIPIMCLTALGFLLAELVMYWWGIVEPIRVSFSILGNYFIAIILGFLPITFASYMMLEGNPLGIKTLSLGLKDSLILSAYMLFYILMTIIFTALYSNERLLKRVQSRIWQVNEASGRPEQLLGSSYRSLNPVYTFQCKPKQD